MKSMTNTQKIRLGTRGSDLARWQTDYVAARLQESYPNLETEITVISTKGDRVLDTPLPLVGGKGVFTAELEEALRSGEIDFAVHSLKDLPTENPPGFAVGAIPVRADPADVLVSRAKYSLDTLPYGAAIGTSSHRRAAQLLHHRPDLKVLDIRGNIDTRVRKALNPDGPYDAILLAKAGLTRLNMNHVISQTFSDGYMMPAPGQGALGIQCRDDQESVALLHPIHDLTTAVAVHAERGFLAGLGGGCSIPVAAHAYSRGDGSFILKGRVCSLDGLQLIDVEISFEAENEELAQEAGQKLADQAIKEGADQILEAIQ